MLYRTARIDEISEIISMKNKVKERVIKEGLPIWQNGYPLDEMIIEDVNLGEGRVVIYNNVVVAYAVFHHATKEYGKGLFKKDNLQTFGRVMVKDGYTGLHISDFLVKSMIQEAKSLKVLGMGITADSCNIRAVNLYQKHGFIKEGEKQFPWAYLDYFGLYFEEE